MYHSLAFLPTIWFLSLFSFIPLGISNTTFPPLLVAHVQAPQPVDILEFGALDINHLTKCCFSENEK